MWFTGVADGRTINHFLPLTAFALSYVPWKAYHKKEGFKLVIRVLYSKYTVALAKGIYL